VALPHHPGVSIPAESQPQQIQSTPEMPREIPTRTQPSNPFLDDPITATGRSRIKPTSFRRR
jgi:hypothetical protein